YVVQQSDVLGELVGIGREAVVLSAVAVFEVGDTGEVGEALGNVVAGLHPRVQRSAVLLRNGVEGPRPLRGVVRTHLTSDGEILVIQDPEFLAAGAAAASAAVDIGERDLVRILGVEPFAHESAGVVAVQAPDPGPRGGVGGGGRGHGGSPPCSGRAAGATGSRAQGIDALTPRRRSQRVSRPRSAWRCRRGGLRPVDDELEVEYLEGP